MKHAVLARSFRFSNSRAGAFRCSRGLNRRSRTLSSRLFWCPIGTADPPNAQQLLKQRILTDCDAPPRNFLNVDPLKNFEEKGSNQEKTLSRICQVSRGGFDLYVSCFTRPYMYLMDHASSDSAPMSGDSRALSKRTFSSVHNASLHGVLSWCCDIIFKSGLITRALCRKLLWVLAIAADVFTSDSPGAGFSTIRHCKSLSRSLTSGMASIWRPSPARPANTLPSLPSLQAMATNFPRILLEHNNGDQHLTMLQSWSTQWKSTWKLPVKLKYQRLCFSTSNAYYFIGNFKLKVYGYPNLFSFSCLFVTGSLLMNHKACP